MIHANRINVLIWMTCQSLSSHQSSNNYLAQNVVFFPRYGISLAQKGSSSFFGKRPILASTLWTGSNSDAHGLTYLPLGVASVRMPMRLKNTSFFHWPFVSNIWLKLYNAFDWTVVPPQDSLDWLQMFLWIIPSKLQRKSYGTTSHMRFY